MVNNNNPLGRCCPPWQQNINVLLLFAHVHETHYLRKPSQCVSKYVVMFASNSFLSFCIRSWCRSSPAHCAKKIVCLWEPSPGSRTCGNLCSCNKSTIGTKLLCFCPEKRLSTPNQRRETLWQRWSCTFQHLKTELCTTGRRERNMKTTNKFNEHTETIRMCFDDVSWTQNTHTATF